MKLGNGSLVFWNFSAPEPNVKRQLYRIRQSLTGGYNATSAAAQDSDSDGIKDMDELGSVFTNPFSKDTDGDGIDDLSEYLAGLNPTVPDDSSPGEFIVQWQRTDSAYLAAKGWRSSATSPAPTKPNYYRSITANATEKKSSATSGQEFNTGKTMTIQRVLQTQTPLRFDPDGSGTYFPIYQEQVTYSYTVGKPFVSINSHLDPANWATPAPGAFASRAKWPGQNIHDYVWNYASPVTNQIIQAEFGEVILPNNVPGDVHTWVNPAVTQGGNRYVKQNAGLDLPNRNFPSSGNVIANATWTGAASASSDETAYGIKTNWTLGNRWTYADVRSELERLRSSLHSVFVAENWDISLPGYALRKQSVEGDAEVSTYEFRFQKVGGGVGPTTLIWPEIFTPLDDPETPANEGASPSVTRLRSVTLPPNTDQSIIFKVDPRVSNFTILPGESAPAGAIPFGSTEIGDLIVPEFELVQCDPVFNPPQFRYFYTDPTQPNVPTLLAVGGFQEIPAPGIPHQMAVTAKAKISFPQEAINADEIASKYELYLYQNIISDDVDVIRYESGNDNTILVPLPALDTNVSEGEQPSPDSIPQKGSFTTNGGMVNLYMVDSPGKTIPIDFNPPGTSGRIKSVQQNTVFYTWLFAQEKVSKNRVFLKWYTWKLNTHVKLNGPSPLDDEKIILNTSKIAGGDGMGARRPVDKKYKRTFKVTN